MTTSSSPVTQRRGARSAATAARGVVRIAISFFRTAVLVEVVGERVHLAVEEVEGRLLPRHPLPARGVDAARGERRLRPRGPVGRKSA